MNKVKKGEEIMGQKGRGKGWWGKGGEKIRTG